MVRAATFKHVGFFDLLCDASFSYFGAQEAEEHYPENRFARTSILSCALSVECFANCLLETLGLPRVTLNDIDRLPTLSKIDSFLRISTSGLLDRGQSEIAKISDLLKARNDFVHVKTQKIESEVGPAMIRSVDTPRYDLTLCPASYQALGIYKNAFAWGVEDAKRSLDAISAFFHVIISLTSEEDARLIRRALISRIEVEGVSAGNMFESYREELERLKSVGVDFSKLHE